MFAGLGKYNSVLLICIVAFAAAASAQDDRDYVVLQGKFVERRELWGHGYLTGDFYYLYNWKNVRKSRLLFEYSVTYLNSTVVSNLYHYKDGAMYSMIGDEKCTGLKISDKPDPWWFDPSVYTMTDEEEGGMHWFVRKPFNVTDPVNGTDNSSDTNATDTNATDTNATDTNATDTNATDTNATDTSSNPEEDEDLAFTGGQVYRILMNPDVTSPSDINKGFLGAIEFSDGRSVRFTDVELNTNIFTSDLKFQPAEVCPTPTCPIYADIVFVLDSSGSVNHTEWAETVRFVNLVMKSFTFGKNAAYAAVVQFNGQDDGCKNTTKIKDSDCKNKKRYKGDCVYPNRKKPIDPDLMATVKASADYGEGPTVSSNPEELMRELNATIRSDCATNPNGESCQAFFGWRGTCQALGLKLAMEVLDRSPRRHYNTKPHKIVIVVTDGEDKYPNMTAENATILRDDYDAFLIEVGVGLECEYDRRYLRSIASKLGAGNNAAYFDAVDYKEIKRVSDELFRPLCDTNFSSECGPECKGFCGAGQCLCPDCDQSGDICHMVLCNVSGGFSNGCADYNETYVIPDDVCTSYACNPEETVEGQSKKGKWYPVPNLCEEKIAKNHGECRSVDCSLQYGGCLVSLNQSVCSELAETICEEWECTPDGELPDDYDSGCRVKHNYTQECIDKLGKKSACFGIKCDGSSLDCKDMEIDLCPGMQDKPNLCYSFSCKEDENGDYSCVAELTDHPADTNCTEWACDNESGWYIAVDRTETFCMYEYGNLTDENATKCKDFSCNPSLASNISGGCYYTERPGCALCSEKTENECRGYGITNSTDWNCVHDFCITVGDGNYTPVCASSLNLSIVQNCLDENNPAAVRARELNKAHPDKCYTPICVGGGRCDVTEVPIPENMTVNACEERRCLDDGSGNFRWKVMPNGISLTCQPDVCTYRFCDPVKGCVSNDVCVSKSNDCYSYKCVRDGDNLECQETNLTVNFIDRPCMKEICTADLKKITQYSECEPNDSCTNAQCVEGYCIYTPKSPEDNDICMTYTCDPDTGNWSATPNCDDGHYCTMDECWNYGTFYECHHETIDCAQKLSMEGYDCFRPYCRENGDNYKCVRKLLPNAYIDICGYCIKDKNVGDSDESEGEFLSCTNAPPEPLTYETLAAASIALIILAAIIAGGAITTSGVIGTKTLIKRAKAARNLAAQCNPLFEGIETEMANPAFTGNM